MVSSGTVESNDTVRHQMSWGPSFYSSAVGRRLTELEGGLQAICLRGHGTSGSLGVVAQTAMNCSSVPEHAPALILPTVHEMHPLSEIEDATTVENVSRARWMHSVIRREIADVNP